MARLRRRFLVAARLSGHKTERLRFSRKPRNRCHISQNHHHQRKHLLHASFAGQKILRFSFGGYIASWWKVDGRGGFARPPHPPTRVLGLNRTRGSRGRLPDRKTVKMPEINT
jgi:hypothetical protein